MRKPIKKKLTHKQRVTEMTGINLAAIHAILKEVKENRLMDLAEIGAWIIDIFNRLEILEGAKPKTKAKKSRGQK